VEKGPGDVASGYFIGRKSCSEHSHVGVKLRQRWGRRKVLDDLDLRLEKKAYLGTEDGIVEGAEKE